MGAPLAVLTLALRVLFNLYCTMKAHLKTQFELVGQRDLAFSL